MSEVTAENLGCDATTKLDDLVDRNALGELCASMFALAGLPIRIYTPEGVLIAGAARENESAVSSNESTKARNACAAGDEGDVTLPGLGGQLYRVVGIDYEGSRVGKIVIGPFAPSTSSVPETVARVATHVRTTLDLILFSSRKTRPSAMHPTTSTHESYRDLEDKNARLQEAYDRLRELDRLKSNFLATVSHELRTPLTSIIGYSEMLKEGLGGELNDEQKEFVVTIHEKGEQLLRLIQSLLDLTKLESGTMKMRRARIGIEPVPREVLSTVTPAARKKNVQVTLTSDGKNADLVGDAERLRQVFLNLVDNALKFTPSGGAITIEHLASANERVVVRVADTGIGIPDGERERVFDAFYQVDSSSTREHGGTGLGLSIVKRLVDSHGGTVHIENNSPKGTVFVVSLPGAGAAS